MDNRTHTVLPGTPYHSSTTFYLNVYIHNIVTHSSYVNTGTMVQLYVRRSNDVYISMHCKNEFCGRTRNKKTNPSGHTTKKT